MNLTQLFALSLEGRANRPALDYDDGGAIRTLTFGDVDGRGNRLAVHLANGVEFIDLYLACVRLGVIFVPMNVLYKERELRHIVGDAEPKAVVAPANNGATYPEAASLWDIDELARAANRDASVSPTTIDGDDPAMIVYTSGTTGVAKG